MHFCIPLPQPLPAVCNQKYRPKRPWVWMSPTRHGVVHKPKTFGSIILVTLAREPINTTNTFDNFQMSYALLYYSPLVVPASVQGKAQTQTTLDFRIVEDAYRSALMFAHFVETSDVPSVVRLKSPISMYPGSTSF